VRALAELCDARLEGDRIDSGELIFSPQRFAARDPLIKIDTAGSIILMLQALLPAVVAARSPIEIEVGGGGADTARAPTFDYFRQVFMWFLLRMGTRVELRHAQRVKLDRLSDKFPRGQVANE
jgi:RNA 3'-terminal phosphate cyclase